MGNNNGNPDLECEQLVSIAYAQSHNLNIHLTYLQGIYPYLKQASFEALARLHRCEGSSEPALGGTTEYEYQLEISETDILKLYCTFRNKVRNIAYFRHIKCLVS